MGGKPEPGTRGALSMCPDDQFRNPGSAGGMAEKDRVLLVVSEPLPLAQCFVAEDSHLLPGASPAQARKRAVTAGQQRQMGVIGVDTYRLGTPDELQRDLRNPTCR